MATKDDSSAGWKNTQMSGNKDKFTNLNLNQNYKSSEMESLRSGSILKASKESFKEAHSHSDSDSFNKNGMFEKNDFETSSKLCPMNLSFNEERDKKQKIFPTESLSLHSATCGSYSHTVMPKPHISSKTMIDKKAGITYPTTAMPKDIFETLRQQQSGSESEAEIMRFNSSQKLLSHNDTISTPASYVPSPSTPKKTSSMNRSTTNPFSAMPSQMDLSDVLKTPKTKKIESEFEWSIEEKSMIQPAVIDSNFAYESPMNSEYDSRNSAYWSQQSIAPSPIRLIPSVRKAAVNFSKSVATQTDISLPFDFDLLSLLDNVRRESPSLIHSDSVHDQSFAETDGISAYDFSSVQCNLGENDDIVPDDYDSIRCDLGETETAFNMLQILDISPINSDYQNSG